MANHFEPDFIQRVIESTNIVELIRGFVTLNKKGNRWEGLCPFHMEKSPSFGIKASETPRIFKCYGCGAGGDAARFLMMKEGIAFPEAIRRLAAKANIPMPDGSKSEWKQKQRRRSAAEIAAEIKQRKARALATRSAQSMEAILERFPWSSKAMKAASRPLPSTPLGQSMALIRLFQPDDIVWCGRFAHSIATEDLPRMKEEKPDWVEEVARCFRTAADWLSDEEKGMMPGPRICPYAMREGAMSRSAASSKERRFLVVEHDSLPLPHQAAMLRWMKESGGMKLRAVVFTGSKSLHGWFDSPPESEWDEMKTVLCGVQGPTVDGKPTRIGGLGFDLATFVPSQPFRVPGWDNEKTRRPVKLCYLS